MNKNLIEREKTFNKKEYDKEYRKKNYRQFAVNISIDFYEQIENYCKDGSQLAIVRRWQDDFRGKRGATMFDALVNNDVVRKLTKGEWTNVYSYSGRWYFCKYDENAKKSIYCRLDWRRILVR